MALNVEYRERPKKLELIVLHLSRPFGLMLSHYDSAELAAYSDIPAHIMGVRESKVALLRKFLTRRQTPPQ